MTAVVRESPIGPPAHVSRDPKWVEVRDQQGYLVLVIVFLQSKDSCLVVDRQDKEFLELTESLGLKLHDPR